MRLVVRVTPRARHDAVEGWSADAAGRPVLNLRVRAPPADGAANAAAARLLAATLGLAGAKVRLAAGGSSRIKAFEIDAADDWVQERLAMR